MSTSLAVQPAYRTSVTERSKANPDRTIYGTTLDNYRKGWELLNDPEVVKEAEELYQKKWKWIPGNPSPQRNIKTTWDQRDKKQILIEEEIKRDFEKLPEVPLGIAAEYDQKQTKDIVKNSELEKKCFSSTDSLPKTSLSKTCTSASSRNSNRAIATNRSNTFLDKNIFYSQATETKQRPMSEPAGARRSKTKIQVPRFRLPPGATNFMRTSSMKITETGAKDLLNAKPVNKVGLGDTLQYNYQDFQRRETPKIYRDNGHVLLMGQRFTDKTTNNEESAPGGFYKANAPDRYINERFPFIKDRKSEVTMTHSNQSKQRIKIKTKESTDEDGQFVDYDIPLNILHKFGEANVSDMLQQNQGEFMEALHKPSDLHHSALVPARMRVKELNHPIDPPTTYFTNFGENLKYDKFDGGLHLYIK